MSESYNESYVSSSTIVMEPRRFARAITAVMSIGERIKSAREARGMSQEELARRVGVSQPAIRKIESGETRKSRFIIEISRELEIPLNEIERAMVSSIQKEPPHVLPYDRAFPGNMMPVYAQAQGGSGAEIITTDAIEHIPRPYTLEAVPEAYGILITGESMIPAFRPGDVAWVNPRLPPARDVEAIFYRVRDGDSDVRAMIKHLIRFNENEWVVEQFNPSMEIRLDREEWTRCHRVVGKFSRR